MWDIAGPFTESVNDSTGSDAVSTDSEEPFPPAVAKELAKKLGPLGVCPLCGTPGDLKRNYRFFREIKEVSWISKFLDSAVAVDADLTYFPEGGPSYSSWFTSERLLYRGC